VKIYKEIFKDKLLVLQNEAFKKDTPNTLSMVQNHLGLKDFNWAQFENETVYPGHYTKSISVKTLSQLKSYFFDSNQILERVTGINYNKQT